ncbi:hypothetical protein H6800_02360 [Candidatus Nomurabacteria bacterium]|nr:hypothetical protein [Candidatus Nomurabacteria bacterium]
MRRLSILLVGIILALAACSSSGNTEDTAVRPCPEVQADLEQAQADLEQATPETPEVTNAAQAVQDLEAEESRACDNAPDSTTSTTEDSTTTTSQAEEEEDPASGLPVVEGGDPAAPTPGSETNQDPRTPVVRDGQVVTGWRGLDQLLGNDSEYINCVNSTVPEFNWGRDVNRFKRVERHGQDTRFILAVNVRANMSDEAIRQIASEDVDEDVSHLDILRVDQIVNTRGFTDGGCERFIDRRSMVRVSLGRVIFNWDGTARGLANDGGIFVDCHNPWQLTVPTAPTPGTTTPGSPDNPDNPPPSSGGGKDHRLSPVTGNPSGSCEACRPNVDQEPPRATPPPATQPTVTTPTTVAPPPPPPTTTTPPRPPGQGCVDPDGIGICQA